MPSKPTLARLRRALAALQEIDEYTEHKPHCPQFDMLNFREAPCECWKKKLTRLLSQASEESWKKG